MNVRATDRFTVQDAIELYGLDGWGNGYLDVADNGHLLVRPGGAPTGAIDVYETVRELQRRGVKTPVTLRFPQLLRAQVDALCGSFYRAIEEFHYPGRYLPVFPLKVNQHRAVVEGLLASGRESSLGIEVGSRTELLAATGFRTDPESLLICNGFKDSGYLASACLAARAGKQVVVVIEKPFELDAYLELAGRERTLPWIGFRIRLQSRGSGLWEKSGGYASKFGLTTLQLLDALQRLSSAGLSDRVALLHFHIGSQITEVRRIKNAVREAARIYAKLLKHGTRIRYIDVGGGLGVDYDGSRTSSDASVNYSVQEYANDIVFGVEEVCAEEQVPRPHIVSESGRMLAAYHSLLVTDVRSAISAVVPASPELTGSEARIVQDLADVAHTISVKNYREYYHDAIEYRDQMYSLFHHGMLDLEDLAKGETYFWKSAWKAVRFSRTARFMAEEFLQLEAKLHDKYICNFSVFQSLPDHWALDQLFPVVPVHRLDEAPTRRATLVDITCDSDGQVEKFVDRKRIKEALEVHELRPGQPYYLAFALVGAYQDTMGDMHNLFGGVNDVQVILDPRDGTVIHEVRAGDPAGHTLRAFGYSEDDLSETVARALGERVSAGDLDEAEAAGLIESYRRRLRELTYLE